MSSVPDDQTSVKSSEEIPGPRIKFLCSYGGKILPKSDGQLRYVGGDTRLLSVRRNIGFVELRHKLEKLFGSNLWLKYQLPNEDLDALISVTCDEDVENLIEEYDRNEARDGVSRLRAFLFPRVEMPSRVLVSSSDQVVDEAKSPKSLSDQKVVETINGPQAQARMRLDSPSVAFQLPDFLFGLDSGGHLVSHHQQQQDGESLSPKRFHSPIDKGSPLRPPLPPLKDPTSMSLQADYGRQQSPRMESGGRGPALITSALGPLTSNYYHTWENKKLWDVGISGDEKDEKQPVELNGEANYVKSQRDACAESVISRIPSKDRIVSMYMEGSHADANLMTDRQGRLLPIMQMERHKLEDVHPDVSPDARQEAAFSGGFRLYRPPEVQRIPQSTPGVTASELPWGLPQPSVPLFEVVAERVTEGHRNNADSEDVMHKRVEGQVIIDNASHPHPTIATAEGSLEGFKFQDGFETYSERETMVLHQQQQNQPRHGEFEVSSPVHAQLEAAQHFHRLGKGHFQQVYWQLRDPQEQHHQQQTSVLEPIRIVHSSSAIQRPMHPVNLHLLTSGPAAHHHYMPSSNVRTLPRSDTLSNARHSSPLYRQAAMAGALRPDPQQLSRGPSPLREHPAGNDPLNSSRYGPRVIQIHEIGYLPSSIAQQSSGLPVPPVYVSDPAEAHNLYDQSGGQLPGAPSPLLEHGTGNDTTGSSRYGQRVVQIHETGYLPSTVAQQTSGLPVPPVYVSDSADAHNIYDQKGVQLPRAPSPLHERPSGNDTSSSSRYGQRVLQVHETGYLPSTVAQQTSGHPVPQVYVSDSADAHNLYDQKGLQLPRAPSPLRERPSGNDTSSSSRYGQRVLQIDETGYLPPTISYQSSGAPVYVSDLTEAHSLYDQNGGQLHYAEKSITGNRDDSIGQVQYSDKMANHDAALGQTHYSDEQLQNPQYVLMSNNQAVQGLYQDAASVHSHQ